MDPWERQTGESSRAYEAFRAYLELGSQRSAAKVGQKLGKSVTLIGRWSAAHRWVDRVEAWERDQDEVWANERRAAVREVGRRHAELAQRFTAKLKKKLSKLRLREMSAADMARWLDVAVKVERLSMGMSTTTIGGTGQGGKIEHSHSVAIREAEQSLGRVLGLDVADAGAESVVDETDK